MYPGQQQNQPRMAGNGATSQQFQQANQATSGVNSQFPANSGYNNQVQQSNYQQQQPQWNNGGGSAAGAAAAAQQAGQQAGAGAYSGQNGFPGYNNPDFNQQWSQQQQNGNTWQNPVGSWQQNNNNNQQPPTTVQPPTVQKQNNQVVSGQASQPPCDSNYQRTFDYVQQCQNWTAQ